MVKRRSPAGRTKGGLASETPEAVFIVGAGYSGSTLLSMVLGGHPRLCAVGELRELDAFVSRDSLCGCGARSSRCAFWNGVRARLPQPDFALHAGGSRDEFLSRGTTLLRAVRAEAGERTVIDASKWPAWAEGQKARGVRAVVLHLVRHPDGVVWSHVRRGADLSEACRLWVNRNTEARRLATEAPGPSLTVRYEDFAAAPEATVASICAALGLEAAPGMLDFRARAHHLISGNPMRFSGSSRIEADESWKERLPPSAQAAVAAATAPLAETFGYR